jgi:hypothetical protein
MSDHIIIADPSRTVRTLVKLAFQDQDDALVEVADLAALPEGLSAPGTRVLIVDEAWAVEPDVRALLTAVGAVVVLGHDTCRGIPWAETLGIEASRIAATPKPVSRRSVRDAADRVTGRGATAPPLAGDLRAMVAEEVTRAVGDEIRSVVWRIVPELAERLIKEELERLLKADEEEE